jgi:hypothetical protein
MAGADVGLYTITGTSTNGPFLDGTSKSVYIYLNVKVRLQTSPYFGLLCIAQAREPRQGQAAF